MISVYMVWKHREDAQQRRHNQDRQQQPGRSCAHPLDEPGRAGPSARAISAPPPTFGPGRFRDPCPAGAARRAASGSRFLLPRCVHTRPLAAGGVKRNRNFTVAQVAGLGARRETTTHRWRNPACEIRDSIACNSSSPAIKQQNSAPAGHFCFQALHECSQTPARETRGGRPGKAERSAGRTLEQLV